MQVLITNQVATLRFGSLNSKRKVFNLEESAWFKNESKPNTNYFSNACAGGQLRRMC